jgi:hypothetical protein
MGLRDRILESEWGTNAEAVCLRRPGLCRALRYAAVAALILLLGFVGAQQLHAAAAGTGTAKISWSAPTANTDGSPYADPDGYYLYWGAAAADLKQGAACVAPACNRVNITAESTVTYTLSGLGAGTYAVAVAAYNKLGVESALSPVKDFTIVKQLVPGSPGTLTISVMVTAP